MASKKKKKILFLSEKSILDFNSGAALELMTWFKYLTAAGHSCFSFSFSCFDGEEEYPVSELVSKEIDLNRDHGKLCNLTVDNIHHTLLLTKSTNTIKLENHHISAFNMRAKDHINEISPDFVILFGSKFLEPLVKFAKKAGAKTIFYLGVSSYTEDGIHVFNAVDKIIVPTDTLKSYYKEKLGLSKMQVVPTSPNHEFERTKDDLAYLADTRRDKFVTMINPAPAKGGLVFINIAFRYLNIDPDITFLAVESRGTRQFWQTQGGIETTAIKNLWWIPKQARIDSVFHKTSILVAPSIAYEAAGKVIAEAMVCGIPVIASDIGGIRSQMNDAGFLIDVPQEVIENHGKMPPDFIDTWVKNVRDLLDDREKYLMAAEDSLKSGRKYRKNWVRKEVLKLFEN